jgi:hypothetical protein
LEKTISCQVGKGRRPIALKGLKMSENLEASKEVLKNIATIGLTTKFGESKGKVLAQVLFGGYGLRGVIGDAELVAMGLTDDPKQVAKQFTEEAATSLALDLGSTAISAICLKAEIASEVFLTAVGAFLSASMPSKVGDAELPPALKKPKPIASKPKTNEANGPEVKKPAAKVQPDPAPPKPPIEPPAQKPFNKADPDPGLPEPPNEALPKIPPKKAEPDTAPIAPPKQPAKPPQKKSEPDPKPPSVPLKLG